MGVLAPCRETPVIQACPAGPAGDRDARFLPCWVQARFCRFGVGRWVVETLRPTRRTSQPCHRPHRAQARVRFRVPSGTSCRPGSKGGSARSSAQVAGLDGRMGSVSGGRVAVLVCLLSRRRRGFLGLVWSRGLPDLLDQHLQRADHRDGQQRRDETAEYMPPIRLPIEAPTSTAMNTSSGLIRAPSRCGTCRKPPHTPTRAPRSGTTGPAAAWTATRPISSPPMSQVPPGNSGGPKRRRLAATAARRRLTVVVSFGPRAQPEREPPIWR